MVDPNGLGYVGADNPATHAIRATAPAVMTLHTPTTFAAMAIASVTLLAMRSPSAWAQETPYGPAVDQPAALAYQAEQRGDFDTAIINYRRSRNAAAALSDPILRDCGVAGAEARLRGAEAAKAYIQQHERSRSRLAEARNVSAAAFQQYWDVFDQARPDLVNSCP